MERRYTSKNPFVHDYNPLTHLQQYNPPQVSFSSDLTSTSAFHRLNEASGFSPTKRLAKSLPRTLYSDPLTGRKVDFSNPSSASTFSSTAAMALVPRMPPVTRIDPSPILAKTRVRSLVSDPITGNSYKVGSDQAVIPSLGHGETLSPIRAPRTVPNSPPLRTEFVQAVAGSRKKKSDSLAYVSPYLLS